MEKNIKDSKNDSLKLNDKLIKLREKNNLLEKENELINRDLAEVQNQINTIIGLLKNL